MLFTDITLRCEQIDHKTYSIKDLAHINPAGIKGNVFFKRREAAFHGISLKAGLYHLE